MQHTLPVDLWSAGQQTRVGGLAVRSGLRGGVCVDVNDQVKAALQTLTDALAGSTTIATAPATTSTEVSTGS